jgi:sec-independent protein translocase protein TatB
VFNNLGWPELVMLLLLGLLIFGPDQLPKIAADLGRMIRQLRKMATDVSADLRDELGPGFEDVDLASLNPRTFIEKHVLGDEPADDAAGSKRAVAVPPQEAIAPEDAPAPSFDPDAT